MSDKKNLTKYTLLPYEEYITLKEGSSTVYGKDISKILHSELLTDQEKISQILNIITHYLEINKDKLKGKHQINNESLAKRDLQEPDSLNNNSSMSKIDETPLSKASENKWDKDISSEGIIPDEKTANSSNTASDVEIETKKNTEQKFENSPAEKKRNVESESKKNKKIKTDKSAISQANVVGSRTRSRKDVLKSRKKWLKY